MAVGRVTGSEHSIRLESVSRARAVPALQRAVAALAARGTPFVLCADDRRLVVTHVAWAPHLGHPAVRDLVVLHGHVVDDTQSIIAGVTVQATLHEGRVELRGSSRAAGALGPLTTGLELLAGEVDGWGDPADQD